MPSLFEEQIEIKLSETQRKYISRQSGVNKPSVRMKLFELKLLAMVAAKEGTETLPVTLTAIQKAIQQVYEPGQNSGQGSESFTIEISLTAEQKEHLRQLTGTQISFFRIEPDDETVLFREPWDDVSHIQVGRTLVIKRADKPYQTPYPSRVIELPLGDNSGQDVFGTGRHSATQLSLILLEEYVESGDRVLDLGTGSGILAVAAARLGGSEVLALDIEADAVVFAQETVAVNNLANTVEVRQGSIESAAPPYDVVAANIFPNVIIRLLPELATSVRQNGVLITGGSVVARGKDVANAICAGGFSLEKQRSQNDWVGMAFRKL
jgi:ribosomal protein L11 methylase PrmA